MDDILVKILVTVGDELHFHQLIDQGPEFELSSGLIETYMDIPEASIRVWHLDPVQVTPNHPGTWMFQ